MEDLSYAVGLLIPVLIAIDVAIVGVVAVVVVVVVELYSVDLTSMAKGY